MRHEPYRTQTHGCRSRKSMPGMASTRRVRGQHRRYESALSLVLGRHAATEGLHDSVPMSGNQTSACDTQHYAQAHKHARVGALPPMPSCLGIGGHTGGSWQDTHGTPVPTQWEGRGWLRGRPQPPHTNNKMVFELISDLHL